MSVVVLQAEAGRQGCGVQSSGEVEPPTLLSPPLHLQPLLRKSHARECVGSPPCWTVPCAPAHLLLPAAVSLTEEGVPGVAAGGEEEVGHPSETRLFIMLVWRSGS